MKQYAFWRYDTYPYFLGGEVTRMNDQGLVETVNYGKGNWFRPVLVVPHKTGVSMMKTLKKLENSHRKYLEELQHEAIEELERQLPDLARHRRK